MLNFGRFCKDISWNLLWFGSWFDCLLVKLLTDPCCLYYLRLLYVFTNDNPSALDETFHWAPAIKILGLTGASNRFMHAVDFCRSVGIYGLQRLYLYSILVREFVYLLLKLRINIYAYAQLHLIDNMRCRILCCVWYLVGYKLNPGNR